MDPLYKNLKQQVTCSICLDTYTQPKTISCLHTFCCECLERHARVSQRQGKFRCPECQAEIDLPEGNRFDGLPNSFLHKSLLGVFEAEETCPQHTEERVRYYCFWCEACICPICVAEDHRGHAFDVLENAVQEDKKNIMLTVETIKEKANLFRAELRKLEKTSEDVERIIAMAKQEVSDATEHVIRMTRQQEKQLLESLEMTRRRRMERINSAKQELISKLKQMSQAAEFAENLVQRRSAADIIQNKNNLKLEELCGVEVPKHRQATFVKFTAASQHNFRLGSIQVSKKPAIVAKSTLEGLNQNFQVNEQAKFTLCPRTSGGEMSDCPEDQVEFLVTPTKDVTNVTVDEEYDGNVRLNFTPKVPGAYNIEVKINGDKLPTCPDPMTVQVKERELVVVGELKLKFSPGDKPVNFYGIAVNTNGTIVLTDNNGHCVYVFDKNGNCLRKIKSVGSNTGQFKYPDRISFLNDNEVLIADFGNCRIQRLNIQTGTVVKSFGKFGKGKGELSNPIDVTVNDEGRVVVTERDNNRIQVMSKEGESIFTFGDRGPEKLHHPTCCIHHKNMFLVSDLDNNCIKAFDQSGTFLYKFGKVGSQDGQFDPPRSLLVDSSGYLLVCDSGNNRVQQFSLDGRFTGKCITRLPKPMAITKAPDGRILVTSHDQKKVYILE